MALNIKDPETDRLARELASITGESITVAARVALEERLSRVRRRTGGDATRSALLAIVARGRTRPRLDERPEDEILGYNEIGLPR